MTTNYKIDIEAPTLETADAPAKAVLERARIPDFTGRNASIEVVAHTLIRDNWRQLHPARGTTGKPA